MLCYKVVHVYLIIISLLVLYVLDFLNPRMDSSISSILGIKAEDKGTVVNTELENHISVNKETDHHSHGIGSCLSKGSTLSRKGKSIPGFAREVIVKVAEMCQQEGSKNVPLFSLNAPTKRAAMYTGVSERTIQRIRGEDRKRKLEADKEDGSKKQKFVDYPDNEADYKKTKRQSRRGQVIPNSARDIISRVISSCYKEFEGGEYLAPLVCRSRRTALYTGVFVRTIQRIKQEDEARNKMDQEKMLTTPGKQRKRSTFRDRIDDFDFHCIRMLIDDLILNKKLFPTCGSLLKAVKELKISFPYGEDTLFRLLHSKGFNWRSAQKGKKILVEKEDIFRGRTHCIRKIKQHESDGKFIVYLDDRWIGTDGTYLDKNGIFGAEGGICFSGRLVVLTEFSAIGMTRRAFKNFRPNTNNLETIPVISAVEKWLNENLFPKIPAHSSVIMSTNAYDQHEFNIPNEYSTKPTLAKFIKDKKLKYDQSQTWTELYDTIKKYLGSKPRQWTEIDKIIEKEGHAVLRLPVYMSEFNPIELACADIKRHLRDNISCRPSFKIIKDTTLQAIENFQNDTLQGYVNHIINMEDYFLKNEKSMQEHYDSVTKKSKGNCNDLSSNDDKSKLLNKIAVSESNIHATNVNSDYTNLVDMKVSDNNVNDINRLMSDEFIPMPLHNQIIYGKTEATPVDGKSSVMCENQDILQPGPSYLNL